MESFDLPRVSALLDVSNAFAGSHWYELDRKLVKGYDKLAVVYQTRSFHYPEPRSLHVSAIDRLLRYVSQKYECQLRTRPVIL